MSELSIQGNTPEILAVERWLQSNFNQVEQIVNADTQHYQIKGVYVRELKLKAGTLLTGKIHNFESIGILTQGTMRITNGDSSAVITAPYITVDKPGIKRLGYAETDCTFVTVHRTDNEEISEIENELVSDTYDEFEIKRLRRYP